MWLQRLPLEVAVVWICGVQKGCGAMKGGHLGGTPHPHAQVWGWGMWTQPMACVGGGRHGF